MSRKTIFLYDCRGRACPCPLWATARVAPTPYRPAKTKFLHSIKHSIQEILKQVQDDRANGSRKSFLYDCRGRACPCPLWATARVAPTLSIQEIQDDSRTAMSTGWKPVALRGRARKDYLEEYFSPLGGFFGGVLSLGCDGDNRAVIIRRTNPSLACSMVFGVEGIFPSNLIVSSPFVSSRMITGFFI